MSRSFPKTFQRVKSSFLCFGQRGAPVRRIFTLETLETLEQDVAELKTELQQLREELLSFRKQFE